jgi:hypothetical protein
MHLSNRSNSVRNLYRFRAAERDHGRRNRLTLKHHRCPALLDVSAMENWHTEQSWGFFCAIKTNNLARQTGLFAGWRWLLHGWISKTRWMRMRCENLLTIGEVEPVRLQGEGRRQFAGGMETIEEATTCRINWRLYWAHAGHSVSNRVNYPDDRALHTASNVQYPFNSIVSRNSNQMASQ